MLSISNSPRNRRKSSADWLKCWNNERGNVFIRCLLVVFVAILLAAAGLISVDSPVEAAGGGYASRCGGGKIFLYAREKRLLTLHDNARKNHGLKPFCVHPALQKAARAHSKDMIQHDYFSHDTRGRN
jgi:hypothetical protein